LRQGVPAVPSSPNSAITSGYPGVRRPCDLQTSAAIKSRAAAR
jgi:hypothetical protein